MLLVFSLLTIGSGDAGIVRIQASDSITLDERSIVGSPTASSEEQTATPFIGGLRGQGSGGEVILIAEDVELLNRIYNNF